jgi:hypothetical protein
MTGRTVSQTAVFKIDWRMPVAEIIRRIRSLAITDDEELFRRTSRETGAFLERTPISRLPLNG